jgi:uncharacterized membrane-anchored protein
MKREHVFAAIVAAQILLLAGWAGSHEWALRTGQTILLETEPVDPRDILRGDYIILAYPAQRILFDQFDPPIATAPAPGTTVSVELRLEGGFHRVARASLGALTAAPGATVVTGRIEAVRWGARPGEVRVTYGIDRFFVPEGKGTPRGKIVAVVAVGQDGRPSLKGLLVDGRPYP